MRPPLPPRHWRACNRAQRGWVPRPQNGECATSPNAGRQLSRIGQLTTTKDRVVIAMLVASEASWVYSLLTVFGVSSEAGGSPLSYFALVGVTSISVVLHSRVRALQYDAFVWGFVAATVVGLALFYLVVAASVQSGPVALDWSFRINDHFPPQGMVFRGLGGFVGGGLLSFIISSARRIFEDVARGIAILASPRTIRPGTQTRPRRYRAI